MAPPKAKGQKMGLGAFLADESLGSWADEMEDLPTVPSAGGGGSTGYAARRDYGSSAGGYSSMRDRDDRYPPRETLPIPDKPPYTAHVGNLSFDVTEGEISDFFATCDVANVRLVRDRMEDRPKGFGYVEFQTREGLIAALDLNGAQLSGRNVRISVAEPPKEGSFVMPAGQWTRGGPLPALDPPRRGGNERFGDRGDMGGERRQSSYGHDDGKIRDFGNWERKGPLSPIAPTTPTGSDRERPRSGDREFRRRVSPAPSAEGGNRREYRERPHIERAPSAAEQDNQWRKPRADRPEPQRSIPTSPSVPHTRPKLELKKRSEAPAEAAAAAAAPTPGSDKPNPFGAAKPIDTFAREREIEEKRLAAAAAKREKEEKAREQRKAEREREARGDKGSDAGTPVSGKDFRMLRRVSAGGEDSESAEASEAPEAPEEPAKKEPAKKEPEKKAEEKKPNASDTWRRGPPKEVAGASKEDKVDGEGWNKVQPRRGRGGANGNRAAVPT